MSLAPTLSLSRPSCQARVSQPASLYVSCFIIVRSLFSVFSFAPMFIHVFPVPSSPLCVFSVLVFCQSGSDRLRSMFQVFVLSMSRVFMFNSSLANLGYSLVLYCLLCPLF